jgi:hypothetical protein
MITIDSRSPLRVLHLGRELILPTKKAAWMLDPGGSRTSGRSQRVRCGNPFSRGSNPLSHLGGRPLKAVPRDTLIHQLSFPSSPRAARLMLRTSLAADGRLKGSLTKRLRTILGFAILAIGPVQSRAAIANPTWISTAGLQDLRVGSGGQRSMKHRRSLWRMRRASRIARRDRRRWQRRPRMAITSCSNGSS